MSDDELPFAVFERSGNEAVALSPGGCRREGCQEHVNHGVVMDKNSQ